MTRDIHPTAAPEGAARRTLRAEILRLAWPAVLENSLHTMVWIADVAFVGRLGAYALSATGLAGQTYFFTLFLFGTIGTAATAMVSRRVGAGRGEEAARIAGQLSLVGAGLGLVVTALVWAGSPAVFAAVGLGPEVARLGVTYQRILAAGSTLFLFRGVLAGCMYGFGDTRSPMVVAALAGGVNIFGNWVLIHGRLGLPAMGVAGAALASLLAHLLGTALTLGIFALGWTRARVDLGRALRFERPVLATAWRLSLPASGEHLFTDLSRTVGVFMIASLGAGALAGHEVTVAAESLSFMPAWGLVIATSILVGQNLGRGDPRQARLAVLEALRLGTAFGVVMAAVFLLFPGPLIRVFTSDVNVVRVASRLLSIAALAQPFMTIQGVFTGALRGAGDTRSPMIAGGVSAWVVRTGATYLAVMVLDRPVEWAWWAMTADWVVRSVWVWLVFRRGRWQEVQV